MSKENSPIIRFQLAINYQNKLRIEAHVIDLIWKPNKDFNLNIQPTGQCISIAIQYN